MKKIFTLLLFLNLCAGQLLAQDAVNSAGGTATGAGGSATYSVGIPIYRNYLSPALYIEEGVQHPIVLNTPLAVQAVEAGATCQNSEVLLSWKAIAANKTNQYLIEKSVNGMEWERIANIVVDATNGYQYLDKSINNTNCYYRIIAQQKDNVENISATVFVLNCNGSQVDFNVYPNPTTDGIYISTTNGMATNTCELLDAQGKIIFSKTITGNTNFVDMKTFAKGTYLARIIHKNKQTQFYKIIKK
jgi:Secretion system C-terminal sorting domain